MNSEAEVAIRYTAGLARLKARQPLGGEHLDFLLPAAIGDVRGDPKAWPPPFEDLCPEERVAVRIIDDVIDGERHPVNRYPRFLGEVSILESQLFSLRNEPLARNLLTSRLTDASKRRLLTTLDVTHPIIEYLLTHGIPAPVPEVDTHLTDFEWLEADPDPDLWHEILTSGSLNYDTEAAEAFLSWVIEQPQCDRATAALLFVLCQRDVERAMGDLDSLSGRLMTRIVQRSERGDGFPRQELTLSQGGEDDDQRPLLARLERGPTKLLGTPFEGRRARSPYVFHSESVIQTGITGIERS